MLNITTKHLRTSRFLSFILIIVALIGCAPISRFMDTAPQTKSYRTALDEWTREESVYNGFDLEANIVVTYKSIPYRTVWADEYARINALTESEKTKLLEDQIAAAGEYHEFFGAAFVPEKDLNDLNERKPSWKIFLEIDGKEKVKPVEVRKVKDEDASYEYFFPYLTQWKTPYIVRFPVKYPGTDTDIINDETTAITLVITGPRGKVEMTWKLK